MKASRYVDISMVGAKDTARRPSPAGRESTSAPDDTAIRLVGHHQGHLEHRFQDRVRPSTETPAGRWSTRTE